MLVGGRPLRRRPKSCGPRPRWPESVQSGPSQWCAVLVSSSGATSETRLLLRTFSRNASLRARRDSNSFGDRTVQLISRPSCRSSLCMACARNSSSGMPMMSTSTSLAASCWFLANEPYRYAFWTPSMFQSDSRSTATAPIVFSTILLTSGKSGYSRFRRKYFWRPLISDRNMPSCSSRRNSFDRFEGSVLSLSARSRR